MRVLPAINDLMARIPRFEFDATIYHIISPGNIQKKAFATKGEAGAFAYFADEELRQYLCQIE